MAQAPQQNFSIDINKMAAMLPMIPNDEQGNALLAQLTTHPKFGALALTEVAKRDRINTMQAAQNATGGGTIRDALLAKLAADDRFGLNNIVSQAEQGAIDFGGQAPEMAPTMMAAGGGMIAFEDGGGVKQTQDGKRYINDKELGRVYEDGSLGYAGPLGLVAGLATRAAPYLRGAGAGAADAALKKGVGALGIGASRLGKGTYSFIRNNPITTGLSGLTSLPFMFGDDEPEGPPVSDTYPETAESKYSAKVADEANKVKELAEAAKGAKNEKEAAKGIADLLGGKTTAADILKERRQLEKEAGLGEYGADVKEKQTKRRAEAEEKFGKEKIAQALISASEAVGAGGKRLEGLGALAAATTGGGKGALSVMEKERAALDKLADAEEKMAMAEDLYKRGDIASAQKMAAEATQQQQANALKLRQIQSTEAYQGMMARAAIARASQSTGVKPGDAINALKQADVLRQRMGMLDPKDPAQAAEIQAIQQELQMLKLLAGVGTMRGAGISIEDVPDEA